MSIGQQIRLTSMASCAGCAAKLSPLALKRVLQPLQDKFNPAQFPQLTVGLGEPDDAAVYKLSEEQAIIQTVDFFPPVVDDPYWFGTIAAANALSDVYAMGGDVLFALNLTTFPDDLDPEILGEILRGGADKVAEAGAAVAGGHSIRDREPKYGLSVTGLVNPHKIMTKGGARIGDRLVLTKPLGVGVITTAIKRDQAEAAHADAAIQSMARLNRVASRFARDFEVKSMTDITGFGLTGHALEMARASQACFQFEWDALPFLPGALGYGESWIFPGGAETNKASSEPNTTWARKDGGQDGGQFAPWQQMMLYDPETSGGLLMALPPDSAQDIVAKMREADQPAWVVGEVVEGRGVRIV